MAIVTLSPDVLFVGSSFSYDFNERQWTGGTRRLLERLAPATKRLVMIRATPRLPFDAIDCLARRVEAGERSGAACTADWNGAENTRVWGSIGAAAAGYGNVTLLDLNELVCPAGHCQAEREDGRVVFRDKFHITASFAAAKLAVIWNLSRKTTLPSSRSA